jgi:hypothetical protein
MPNAPSADRGIYAEAVQSMVNDGAWLTPTPDEPRSVVRAWPRSARTLPQMGYPQLLVSEASNCSRARFIGFPQSP